MQARLACSGCPPSGAAKPSAAMRALLLCAALLAGARAAEYTGTQCIGVVDFPLVDDVGNIYTQETNKFANLPRPPYLKQTIARSLRQSLCLELFAPLAAENSQACADACMGLYSQFKGGITAKLSPVWSNAVFSVPTLEECKTYPTTDCQKGGEPIHYEEDVAQCPMHYDPLEPTDYNRDGDIYFRVDDTDCAPSCPVRFYADHEWTFANKVAFGISWAGTVLSGFVLGCYLWYKKNQQLVIFFTTSCFVSSLAVAIFLTLGGADTLVCLSKTVWDEHSPGCITQAAFTVWGFLSAICWTVCQALDVHARVVLEYRHTKIEKVRKFYPLIGGVVPFVAVVMLLATDHLGFDVQSPFDVCFITKKGDDEYLYVFFVGVQAAACLACLVMMAGVIARITTVMRAWDRTGDATGSGRPSQLIRVSGAKVVKAESATMRTIRYNSRPIMFIILCALICVMNVVLVFYYIDTEDKVYDGAVDYARCLFASNAAGIDKQKAIDECGRYYKDRHPVELHASITAGISCLALLPFLVYGYSLPPTRAFLSWLTNRTFSDSHDPQETSDQDSGTIFSWRRGNKPSRQSASSTRARASMEMADMPNSPTSPKTKSDGRLSEDSQMRSTGDATSEANSLPRTNSTPVMQANEHDAKRRANKILRPAGSRSESAAASEAVDTPDDVESQGVAAKGSGDAEDQIEVTVSKPPSDKGSEWDKLGDASGQEMSPTNSRAHFDL